MSSGSGRKLKLLQDLVLIAAAVRLWCPRQCQIFTDGNSSKQQVSTYYLVRYVLSQLDPEASKKEEARKKSAAVLRRIEAGGAEDTGPGDENDRGRRIEDLNLNQYEHAIASELIAPNDIPVTFAGSYSPVRFLDCLAWADMTIAP